MAGVSPNALEAMRSSVNDAVVAVERDAQDIRSVLSDARQSKDRTIFEMMEQGKLQSEEFSKNCSAALDAQQVAFEKLKSDLEGITAAYETQRHEAKRPRGITYGSE
ncbi:hypothetical protein [Bradyrhizobium ottawaense]|uniref:hypothetical protein n=1 Tax=Bradyrhizobium ottawaense TaxID=931866 RepID=UPI0011782596|nr:hypothetical protein [Bradyrhizobium ottawaense]